MHPTDVGYILNRGDFANRGWCCRYAQRRDMGEHTTGRCILVDAGMLPHTLC